MCFELTGQTMRILIFKNSCNGSEPFLKALLSERKNSIFHKIIPGSEKNNLNIVETNGVEEHINSFAITQGCKIFVWWGRELLRKTGLYYTGRILYTYH